MRKCKICDNSLIPGNQIKIRFGVICPNCYEKLPNCAKGNAGRLTPGQIRKLLTLFKAPHGKFRWTLGNIKLGEESILFSGKEILLKDLKSFRFQFHPAAFYEGKAEGKITVAIETKNPHIYLEDYYLNETKMIRFHIQGENVIYHFTDFCYELTDAVQSALNDGSYNLSEFYKTWEEKKKQSDFKKESAQNNKKTSEKDAYRRSSTSRKSSTSDSEKKSSSSDAELSQALKLYSLKMPYKKAEVKEIRNILLKKHHPDCSEGSEEKCKEINLAYTLLMKYAEE